MLLVVGEIVRPHGIRGEVAVEVRTDEPEARFAVGSVLCTDPTAARPYPRPDAQQAAGDRPISRRVPERLTVESARWHQNRLLVRFEGVYDRNAAEELRGVLLCVDSGEIAPPTEPDEYHDIQLIGLAAVDTRGEPLGEVVRVEHAPASDLLVVRRPDGRTALVPFVSAIVPQVDLAGGRVVIDPPGGLLDL
ncbi:MAG TPA: ribosome maturation factor RimM [Micromonospora sp.]